ncbi:enoyl-CoA hydratase-related protein [Nocardioides hungaricus]
MPVTLAVDSRGVAHLVLDRPEKRNALDVAMLESLREQVAAVRSRDDVRVAVVRGAGGTFCAGADIADWVDPGHVAAVAQSRLGQETFAELAALDVPSVAVVEGGAYGGGLELALACDLRLAAYDARMGLPELGLGNLPSWGGTARLVDLAGLGVARHVLLSGELLTGERAAQLLVVTSAHPTGELDGALAALVDRLLQAEPTAVGLAKQVLAGFERTLATESALAGYTACLDSSRDRKQSFLDRRAAARAARPTTGNEGTAS